MRPFTEAIQEYYQHADLQLPTHPNWHFWRFKLQDGNMIQIHKRVSTIDELRELLVQYAPLHCYVSANEFLDASHVSYNEIAGRKAGYPIASNILIGDGVLTFDVDAHDRPLRKALQEARKLQQFIEQRYAEVTVNFTGRGFHLFVAEHDLHLTKENPIERLTEYSAIRQPLLTEICAAGIHIDTQVTLDPKRIVRAVGSLHGLTGYICSQVNLDNFNVRRVGKRKLPRCPVTERNDAPLNKKRVEQPTWAEVVRTTPKLTPYISTRIPGTRNRTTLLLEFESETNMREKLSSLLRRNPELTQFIILKHDRKIYAFNPTAVELEHIPNLLKTGFQEAKSTYLRYGKRLLQLPATYDSTIGQPNDQAVISKVHAKYLKHAFGLSISGVHCGNGRMELGGMKLRQ